MVAKKKDDVEIPRLEPTKIMGSSFLSNVIIVDHYRYRIKDIVEAAYTNSKMEIGYWNALPWAIRDDIIGAQIYLMRMRYEAKEPITWVEAVKSRVRNPQIANRLKSNFVQAQANIVVYPRRVD